MKTVVTFLDSPFGRLEDAMRATVNESVVIGLGSRLVSADRLGVLIDEVVVVPDAGYRERSAGHFTLHPKYVAEVLLGAALRNRTAVLIHSHPGASHPPSFSNVDERMHEALMPAFMRELRPPVGSLVWSQSGLAGALWTETRRVDVDEVRVVGAHLTVMASRREEADLRAFDRQMRVFGRPVQEKLRGLRVAVVGLGGTGSLACDWLAHLGVRDFILVDPDALEVSNLSRIAGSKPSDVGAQKTAVAERAIRSIAPGALVRAVTEDVTRCAALEQVVMSDVIFACTDSHASRAALNAASYQYAIPMLDVGSLIRREIAGVNAFSELRFVAPGLPCLRCLGLLDTDRVFAEQLTPTERTQLKQFGYAPGELLPEPSVLPLNALGVSLATLKLLDVLEPWLNWEPRVTVSVRELNVIQRVGVSSLDCDVCGQNGLTARGDDEPLRCRP